jgi:hypothetical protein
MRAINRNSFPIAGAGLLLVVAYFLLRDGATIRDAIILLALLAALVVLYLLLRPRASQVADAQHPAAQIGAGLPVLLELQSRY